MKYNGYLEIAGFKPVARFQLRCSWSGNRGNRRLRGDDVFFDVSKTFQEMQLKESNTSEHERLSWAQRIDELKLERKEDVIPWFKYLQRAIYMIPNATNSNANLQL